MAEAQALSSKYDIAAPRWGDKMRVLGYFDAYLGFLSSQNVRAPAGNRVLDIGCGTGAFAEAWVAIHGPDQAVTLLDPAAAMLTHAKAALAHRNVQAETAQVMLEDYVPAQPFHCVLAAHVLEHASDPCTTLKAARDLVPKGGRLWLVVSKPHWCNAIIWLQWRHRAFRPAQVQDLLAESGWQLDMEYAFPSGPPSRTSRGYLAQAI